MEQNFKIADTTANPGPLGLIAFALTTILLNLHNAGFFPINGMIMAMGIFYGGIAQVIAGIMEWKKGNTFGLVAFLSFGAFWLSLVFIWVTPRLGLEPADPFSMGCFLTVWGLLVLVLFVQTLKGPTIGKLVFGSLVVLFFLLALTNFTQNPMIGKIAGYEGILCGFLAFYEGAAIMINQKYGKTILPM